MIRFLAAVGCRVTENVLNWVRAVNPNMAEELHSLAKTPASLVAQARYAATKNLYFLSASHIV